MSYTKPDTGDSMNDYFTALADFVMLAPNLLKAKDKHAFLIWLDKLEQIDRRSLLLYLRKHKDEIPPEFMKLAQYRYVQEI